MFGIGIPELIVILALALIVIGPEQLPDVAKQIARFVNELRKAGEEFKRQVDLESIKKLRDEPAEWEKDIKETIKKSELTGGMGPEWKKAQKGEKESLSSQENSSSSPKQAGEEKNRENAGS